MPLDDAMSSLVTTEPCCYLFWERRYAMMLIADAADILLLPLFEEQRHAARHFR